MKSKTSLLFGLLFFFIGNLFSQSYNIKWGNMEKQSGRLQSVLPISGSDFYTLRWSGGALLGSLRLSRHDNLSLTATGKLVMQVDGSMANFEDATYMGDKLVVFLSDRKDGKNTIFMQEYNRDLTTKGSAKKMASYLHRTATTAYLCCVPTLED